MKEHYSRFLAADPARLHFAAHSHHPWPDVTRAAQIDAWDDAARLADHKWDRVFGTIVPEAQGNVAAALDAPSAGAIAFAPNTHEFVCRLLSCFEPGRKLRVVTTDSEFFSFARQIARFEEEGLAEVVRVPAEPFAGFASRFESAARDSANDLVFFSQVFYNSGVVVDEVERLVHATPENAMVVVDGYHAFFAVPTSIRNVADRAFYLAGGYKYAQAGEGACFLVVPKGFAPLPIDTGWFAGFGALESGDTTRVPFATDGSRFMGATFDPAGLYRFNAVARLYRDHGMTIESVDAHVKDLQARFVSGLDARPNAPLSIGALIAPGNGLAGLGHFLTFRTERAGDIERHLAIKGVVVDHRGDRLRFGFGAYHDASDVDRLITLL